MIKLEDLIKQMKDQDFESLCDSFAKSKADKFLSLLIIMKEGKLNEKEIVLKLELSQNAYYTLKSRLYDKIQEVFISANKVILNPKYKSSNSIIPYFSYVLAGQTPNNKYQIKFNSFLNTERGKMPYEPDEMGLLLKFIATLYEIDVNEIDNYLDFHYEEYKGEKINWWRYTKSRIEDLRTDYDKNQKRIHPSDEFILEWFDKNKEFKVGAGKTSKYYNVYIGTSFNRYFINGLSEINVQKIVAAFNKEEPEVFVKGIKILLKGLIAFMIFDTSKLKSTSTPDEIDNIVRKNWLVFHRNKEALETYKEIGNEVTDLFGVGEKVTVRANVYIVYINETRIEELKRIKDSKFDLVKLCRLCEEVNNSFQNKNYFATGALVRAIIDHVPPIFEHKIFNEVANNYKAKGTGRSFSDSMKHLNDSMRKISDKLLHATITNKEALPNETQIDCRRDLDVLLEEIVRILK